LANWPLVIAVVLAALLAPASAQAGTYDVYACRLPDGSAAPAGGWSTGGLLAGADVRAAAGCPLTVSAAPGPTAVRPITLGWRFDAVDDTTIAAYDVARSAVVTTDGTGAFNYEGFLDSIDYSKTGQVDHCWSSAGCRSLAPGQPPLARSGLAARSLILFTDCSSGNGECHAPMTASIVVESARMTLNDTFAPVFVAPPSGSLFDTGAPLTGVRSVSYSAADRGGGLYRAALEVDGSIVTSQPVDENGGACVAPFTQPLPCKLSAASSLSWDTGAVANGPHRLRLLVYDATGTNVVASDPVDVVTANGPGQCAPTASAGSVAVRFGIKRGRSLTLSYGRARTIRGAVTDAAGAPVPGATVVVLSRVRRSGARTRAGRTPIVTGADGRFVYRIPKGPSRLLRFGWRSSTASSLLTCSAALHVNVRAPVGLSVSPRVVSPHGRIRLSGRLRGGYVPARGRVLDLQALVRGSWRPFETVRTSGRGRFSATYRFTSGERGTFRIRVRVRPSSDYPFTLGYSRAVRVRVR
jgi:hypothetical protein